MNRLFRKRTYISLIAILLRPVLKIIETYLYDNILHANEHKPIFIIGSPRSGSTILYQILTQNSEYIYIDNLACPFKKNIRFGIWLSRFIYKSNIHGSFDSKYGNTISLHAPSECQSFWHQWFPKSRDYVDLLDITDNKMHDMSKVVNSIMDKFKKDIIFKNLSCSQRIKVLHKAFPNARFIVIKRDPLYTLQSLLLARKKLGINDEVWWSVKPANYLSLQKLPLIEKLSSQIFYTESQIEKDLKVVPKDKVFRINYLEYGDKINELFKFLDIDMKNAFDLSDFRFENNQVVSDACFEELKYIVNMYRWDEAGYEQ